MSLRSLRDQFIYPSVCAPWQSRYRQRDRDRPPKFPAHGCAVPIPVANLKHVTGAGMHRAPPIVRRTGTYPPSMRSTSIEPHKRHQGNEAEAAW